MQQNTSASEIRDEKLAAGRPTAYPVQAFLEVCQTRALLRNEDGKFHPDSLPEFLTRLCLDPACLFDDCAYFDGLRTALRELLQTSIAELHSKVVVTEIGQHVYETLDYCLAERCMVLIDGLSRTGKTFAAKAWSGERPGRVRYVQVPSSNDQISFIIAIARALNISIESTPKENKLRRRVEDVLQSGDLALVLDEAHYCWPQSNYRHAKPTRINWIMTALVNHGVPVALVTTPQFSSRA